MRTITGNVDPVFAGKQAILFVYKIDEAADYTNEAVAQTTIGENGEYFNEGGLHCLLQKNGCSMPLSKMD